MSEKSWWLEDAQAIADAYPYTFYKPSNVVISQLKPGNLVKLIFSFDSDAPEAPRAERMWVEITDLHENDFSGLLRNDPGHIHDLAFGEPLAFQACHIIATDINDPIPSITNKYAKRCFVTNNILYDDESVGYLYREEPEYEDDSGWRLSTGMETDEYMEDPDNISYVSLGAVLQVNDAILGLLDNPPGAAFIQDDNGEFIVSD